MVEGTPLWFLEFPIIGGGWYLAWRKIQSLNKDCDICGNRVGRDNRFPLVVTKDGKPRTYYLCKVCASNEIDERLYRHEYRWSWWKGRYVLTNDYENISMEVGDQR